VEMTARSVELTCQMMMLTDRIGSLRGRIKEGALINLECLQVDAAGQIQAREGSWRQWKRSSKKSAKFRLPSEISGRLKP